MALRSEALLQHYCPECPCHCPQRDTVSQADSELSVALVKRLPLTLGDGTGQFQKPNPVSPVTSAAFLVLTLKCPYFCVSILLAV